MFSHCHGQVVYYITLSRSVSGFGIPTFYWVPVMNILWKTDYIILAVFKTQPKKLSVLLPWISNHKHKIEESLKKVPGPPPKLSASGWRTGSNLEHWYWYFNEWWITLSCQLEFKLTKDNPYFASHRQVTSSPLYWQGLALIPAWISN